MRQGYLSFHCEDSPTDNLGGPCFGASALAFPLPFFFPFEDLSVAVEWTTWTSKGLLGLGGFCDELLGKTFETDFCLEEDLAGA